MLPKVDPVDNLIRMNRRSFLKSAVAITAIPYVSSLARSAHPVMQPVGPSKRIARFGDGRDWFFEKRFGLFVHWGLYAIAGWHEQHQWRGRVPRAEYVKLAEQWNPVKFDPDAWLDLWQSAGMQYVCLTTKHHDGFCLWDTKQTAYNTMNTPYGKDVVGMLAEACHRRRFPLCLYYSIADWHHPNYPTRAGTTNCRRSRATSRTWTKYLEFLKGQVRELCTNYGEIHGFWWDMNVPKHVDPSINAMIRELQPKAVINDRGFDEGDFGTPERDYDEGGEGVRRSTGRPRPASRSAPRAGAIGRTRTTTPTGT